MRLAEAMTRGNGLDTVALYNQDRTVEPL